MTSTDAIFITSTTVAAVIVLFAGGAVGYHANNIYRQLEALRKRQDEAEKDAEPINAVVIAKTPQEVKRYGEQHDSAIITAKRPIDIQRAKDLQLQRDIDADNA